MLTTVLETTYPPSYWETTVETTESNITTTWIPEETTAETTAETTQLSKNCRASAQSVTDYSSSQPETWQGMTVCKTLILIISNLESAPDVSAKAEITITVSLHASKKINGNWIAMSAQEEQQYLGAAYGTFSIFHSSDAKSSDPSAWQIATRNQSTGEISVGSEFPTGLQDSTQSDLGITISLAWKDHALSVTFSGYGNGGNTKQFKPAFIPVD